MQFRTDRHSFESYASNVDRLETLRQEFQQTSQYLEFPTSIEDFDQLKERLYTIRREAQALANRLDLSKPVWLDVAS